MAKVQLRDGACVFAMSKRIGLGMADRRPIRAAQGGRATVTQVTVGAGGFWLSVAGCSQRRRLTLLLYQPDNTETGGSQMTCSGKARHSCLKGELEFPRCRRE